MSENYRVRLDAFEGPMDLLLYLIAKHEVDLHDIPISLIADQYIGFLDDVDRIDIDLAGEFLVMATTLMELKSRMLAAMVDAKDQGEGGGDDASRLDQPGADPRMELVHQLLEYKKYRDASDILDERRRSWAQRYPVKAAPIDDDSVRAAIDEMGELELEDLDLSDLVECFRQIVASVNFDRLGEHEVMSDETPIEVHAQHIIERLSPPGLGSGSGGITLGAIVEGKSRAEMVGMFLAILVLVRDQRVGVAMDAGEVVVVLRSDVREPTEVAGIDDLN